jgi:acyl phosphate:glycerol-3-phosphate acyltransferase
MNLYLYLVTVFLLGGIPFGLVVCYLSGKGDIRKLGSGNIGATNVWRVAGAVPAIFVFIGDIGKGAAAVLLTGLAYRPTWPLAQTTAALAAGLIAVLGHIFSPYVGFRGGKGVNTALGAFFSLMPVEVGAAVVVFVFVTALFRFVSLGSLCGVLTLLVLLLVERYFFDRPIPGPYVGAALFLTGLIIYAHRQNIRRLLDGTEHRLQLRRSPS